MLAKPVIEVILYELIKSYHQIENLVREIDPERFGVSRQHYLRIPELTHKVLHLCTICGDPHCTSDHK